MTSLSQMKDENSYKQNTGRLLERLTKEIRKKPVDLGMIGIGENAHIDIRYVEGP
jgi:6-phosphogluconolactonase/glucosamine-6-phosphate isomerase/deaminase